MIINKENMETMETIKVYVLKFEYPDFVAYDFFKNKYDTWYVQYTKKWDDKYTTKHWKLEELCWFYQNWNLPLIKVSLIEREINL